MRKVFFSLAILACLFLTTNAQTTFGVHINGISSNVKEGYNGVATVTDRRLSYKFGFMANIPLTANLGLLPQFNYLSKGTRINISETSPVYQYTAKGYMELNYLEVPVPIVYKQTMKNNNVFMFGGGPSVSFGLNGRFKTDIKETRPTYPGGTHTVAYTDTEQIKFDGKSNTTNSNPNDSAQHYKALEFGIHLVAGYQFRNGWFLNMHFNQGLSNINTDANTNDKGKTQNNYFGLGVGYFFRRK